MRVSCRPLHPRCPDIHVPAEDYDKIMASHSSAFLWMSYRYYLPMRIFFNNASFWFLKKYGGPLRKFEDIEPLPAVAAPVAAAAQA